MRKRYLKVAAILLCFLMLCNIPTNAYALEPYASAQISAHSAILAKDSDGYLYVAFTIDTNRVMNILGASSVVIQRYSFFQWVNEYTFTPENMPELLTTNDDYHVLIIPYDPLFPNATYRAIVYFYAESDTMISTAKGTTNTVPKTA